ncbi:MAG: DUF3307 domain-containing protein [Lysobacterales bacterium]|jgi:hypothetical protein
MTLFFQFLVGHALGDFVFQRDIMARSKSRHAEIHQTAGKGFPGWYYWLLAHALIHGGTVFLISGSLLLGVIETLLHSLIDFGKCERWYSIHVDQALHILCKFAYVWAIQQGLA